MFITLVSAWMFIARVPATYISRCTLSKLLGIALNLFLKIINLQYKIIQNVPTVYADVRSEATNIQVIPELKYEFNTDLSNI